MICASRFVGPARPTCFHCRNCMCRGVGSARPFGSVAPKSADWPADT